MNRKALVLVSTIAVFIMTAVVACVWLFRVRYIDLSAVVPDGDVETFKTVDEELKSRYSGKLMPSLNINEVADSISENPYVKVISVKKVFPDRLEVSIMRRVEKYIIEGKEFDYITDDDYILLKKIKKTDERDDKLIKIEVSEKDISETDMEEGKIVTGSVGGLFNSAVEIFNAFEDKFDLIESVKISGDFHYVRFKTKTGVVFDFSFLPIIGTTAPSSEDYEHIKPIITSKAKDVQEYYSTLSEGEKRNGVIYVNIKIGGEVAIEWNAE